MDLSLNLALMNLLMLDIDRVDLMTVGVDNQGLAVLGFKVDALDPSVNLLAEGSDDLEVVDVDKVHSVFGEEPVVRVFLEDLNNGIVNDVPLNPGCSVEIVMEEGVVCVDG